MSFCLLEPYGLCVMKPKYNSIYSWGSVIQVVCDFFWFRLGLKFSLFSSIIEVTFNSVNESMSVLMIEQHLSQLSLSYITNNLTS